MSPDDEREGRAAVRGLLYGCALTIAVVVVVWAAVSLLAHLYG